MIGITSYGAYLPFYRLGISVINKAWGGLGGQGERTIANYDEDAVTMAVEAARDCMKGVDRDAIDTIFLASTTAPYREKQSAALIAGALDFGDFITTADFANTLRAGTGAVKAALAAVQSGNAKSALVTSAECRLGNPGSREEQVFGDAGAALIIGSSNVIATIEDIVSVADEIIDVWRTDRDLAVHSWEDRWVVTQGYDRSMRKSMSAIMEKNNLTAKDFAKAVFGGPDLASHSRLAKALGFDLKTQVQDPLFGAVGNAGAAHSILILAAALQEAKPGDRLLFAGYGDGSDAFILKVTENILKVSGRRGVKGYLQSKMPFTNYTQYCNWHDNMNVPRESGAGSASLNYRDKPSLLRFHAAKCRSCSLVSFPIQRVCFRCGAMDEYDEVKLADRIAKIFTYAKDTRGTMGGTMPESPLISVVLETDDGCRIYSLLTDRDPDKVAIGLPVEFTFRKWSEGVGFHNYFWKCRPARGE
ncbi:MAG: hydroxymethylglutaryl-CoA synthase family protein [Smithellaceae bacterium]